MTEPAGPAAMAALPAAGPVNQAADVGSEWGRRHIWLTWMTCAADRLEHAVTDEDFAAGLSGGFYRAVCDHLVAAQALVSPPGRRCVLCMTALHGRGTRPQRGSWLHRALNRLTSR